LSCGNWNGHEANVAGQLVTPRKMVLSFAVMQSSLASLIV